MIYIFSLILALIFFVFLIIRKQKFQITLKNKTEIASLIYGFWFERKTRFNFLPGQFLEWTLYHQKADNRGIKRYFTIASSPTEKDILLATKISSKPSTFKQNLKNLEKGKEISVSKPQGDFVLPQNIEQKLVFIAGGIGITPFRSMIKYLIDKGLKRDIILFYAANLSEEFSFKDILEKSEIKTVYIISDQNKVPENWQGEIGYLNEVIIKKHVPDWPERLFYVSGPEPMVQAINDLLVKIGIPPAQIKKDYFPGYSQI